MNCCFTGQYDILRNKKKNEESVGKKIQKCSVKDSAPMMLQK